MERARITAGEEVRKAGALTKLVTDVSIAVHSALNMTEGIMNDLGLPTAVPSDKDEPREVTLRNTAEGMAADAAALLERIRAIRAEL